MYLKTLLFFIHKVNYKNCLQTTLNITNTKSMMIPEQSKDNTSEFENRVAPKKQI